jgi:hypothetical protein
MERRLARSGPWTAYQWECVGVVCGEDVVDGRPGVTLLSDDGERARFMWSGMDVCLFKDGCESYWYNLQSETPYLFVICHHDEMAEDESMAVAPAVVSANQDEANAHMESEDLVYSVPMPRQVVEWLERFVVDHYAPVVKKKRKRRDWAMESEEHAKARRTGRFH